ncbi:MAG: 4Fe-4S binding protein [Clostridiales bacterium]|nr:4Fe-4S binding protein [Clostridiales bacterium]
MKRMSTREITQAIDIEAVLRGVGVTVVERVNPLELEKAVETVKRVADLPGVKAILFESPCAMLFKPEKPLAVTDSCVDCRMCIKEIGCPGLIVSDNKVKIDPSLCNGCGLCSQVCPVGAISKEGSL